jgi:hypothetical protein
MRHARFVAPLALALAAGASFPAHAATPNYTITSVAKTGDPVPPVGQINSPLSFGNQGGRGVLRTSINNNGLWFLHIDTPNSFQGQDEAILRAPSGLSPWIAEGFEGYLSAPTASSVASTIYAMDSNGAGDAVTAMGLAPDEFSAGTPTTTGVLFNRAKVVFLQGDAVNAAGLDAGTVWAAPDFDTKLALNDSNQLLVVSRVVELGATKRAVLRLALDASGNVLSRTLLAKEGGPVGAGPDTWTVIAPGAHAAAMNNSGVAVFSGATSAGVTGVYKTGAGFVARNGDASPIAGSPWGSLLGAPVDINTPGNVVFRGVLNNSSGTAAEINDAGDIVDAEQKTFGNGALNRITGTLSSDHDVDLYRIQVTDPAAFSATTVPAAGFAGAAFDTVLTLIAEPGNGTRVLMQSDDAAPGVVQSTIAGPFTSLVAGRQYYLGVSTPRSRVMVRQSGYATASNPLVEAYASDPADVALGNNTVFWSDPSAGTIGSVPQAGGTPTTFAATLVGQHLAADSSKIYWVDRQGTNRIRSANYDGTGQADLVAATGFGNVTAFDCTGLAVDPPAGKLYWTRANFGEINRCNLDGSGVERVLQDYPPTGDVYPLSLPSTGTLAPGAIAVDPTTHKLYWYSRFLNSIESSNADGSARTNLNLGAGAGDVSVFGSNLYWTEPANGRIMRAPLAGGTPTVLVTAGRPRGLSVKTTGIVFADLADRTVRTAPLAGGASTVLATIPKETGQSAPDGEDSYPRTFDSFARFGAPTPGALTYEIKLTGATFAYPQVCLAKDAQKIAATGDPVGGVANSRMVLVSADNGPVRIDDRGNVLWNGFYQAPTPYINFLFDALYYNTDLLLTSMQVVPDAAGQRVINLYRGGDALDLSRDGTKAMVLLNMQDPPFNFTLQRDNALLLTFNLPSPCRADYNGQNGVDLLDIFAFLNDWFAGNIRADFNQNGAVDLLDIFAFLTAWFTGC